jgi:protein-S-isoprenylcysteine O-methyltransferase Ste14
MAGYEESMVDLLKGAIDDARELIAAEIALARAELQQEIARLKAGVAALAGAAFAGLVALLFLLTTVAWALSEGFGWPVWAGYGIVTLVMGIVAGALAYMGRAKLASGPPMPKTVDTLKENMRWMRARTQP